MDGSKVMLCASCGTTGGDDIKLKKCTGCYLVQYCGIECQKEHRPKHKKECKKRAAELKDELLFNQPEGRHDGDCPICCLPLPIDPKKSILMGCCGKVICNGCSYVNQKREDEGRLLPKCPFCRTALPDNEEEHKRLIMKRFEVNDPQALCSMGFDRYDVGDYKSAFEYLTRAASLLEFHAHYKLSSLYRDGYGVEKDEKKRLHHLEQAAIGGHPNARFKLGCFEVKIGRMDRAAKHFIIAAKLGDDESLAAVKDLYKAGHVSKDDFAAALRGHQAAIDATKSPHREEAATASYIP